jgi:hypothetical protein
MPGIAPAFSFPCAIPSTVRRPMSSGMTWLPPARPSAGQQVRLAPPGAEHNATACGAHAASPRGRKVLRGPAPPPVGHPRPERLQGGGAAPLRPAQRSHDTHCRSRAPTPPRVPRGLVGPLAACLSRSRPNAPEQLIAWRRPGRTQKRGFFPVRPPGGGARWRPSAGGTPGSRGLFWYRRCAAAGITEGGGTTEGVRP